MVNLTRIYTRTGDDGTTALGDFSRTRKTDSRLAAYADVDETNAAGGVNPLTATYLNRLSDLLFILARHANHGAGGDVLWEPGGGRETVSRPAAEDPGPEG